MLPCITIPRHITALYVFAALNWLIMVHITFVDAHINVLDEFNQTVEEIMDMPTTSFGSPIPKDGVYGILVVAKPITACSQLHFNKSLRKNQIVLIARGNCTFVDKVLHAQQAGYPAAIVFNDLGDDLVPMSGGERGQLVNIPSAFIARGDADYLMDISERKPCHILLDNRSPLNPNIYLLPFAVVVGVCFVLMLVFMVIKWVRDLQRQRRNRLSKSNLKKIPIKKFKKGDEYDVCAICLEDYEEGDKMRILPCSHAYHVKCVDPWLTKNKRTCPICKRKVIPGDDSDSDDSDEEEGTASEHTPLLTPQSHGSIQSSRGSTFANSGLPAAVQSRVVVQSDSDDSADLSHLGAAAVPPPSGSYLASVHSYGSNDTVPAQPSAAPNPSQETQQPGKRKRRSGGTEGESSRSQRSERRRRQKSRPSSRRSNTNAGYQEMANDNDNIDEPVVVTVQNTSSRSRRSRNADVEGATNAQVSRPSRKRKTQELSEAVNLGDESDEEPVAAVAQSRYNDVLSSDVERAVEVQIAASSEEKNVKAKSSKSDKNLAV